MKNTTSIIFFLLYAIISSSGLVLFKSGSENLKVNYIKGLLNLEISSQVLIGILCYGLSFIMWLLIVNKLDLTYAMPLGVGLTNIFVIIGSKFILKEEITINKIIAIVLIVIAVFIINIDKIKN